MQKTTIAGFITALVGMFFAILSLWVPSISADLVATVTTIGITVVAIFADPNQIKSVSAMIALIIEKGIYLLQVILSKFYPEIGWTAILPFLQPIAIFAFSFVIQDPNKSAIQPRAPATN
jgi:hypothetical protein